MINLPPSRSDHVPLLMQIRKELPVCTGGKKDYKFEEIWVEHSDFERVLTMGSLGIRTAN